MTSFWFGLFACTSAYVTFICTGVFRYQQMENWKYHNRGWKFCKITKLGGKSKLPRVKFYSSLLVLISCVILLEEQERKKREETQN